MLTTIQGTYENGKITLDEIPPLKSKSKIVVTFLEEISGNVPVKRRLGGLRGKIGISDDFNDPIDDLNEYMYE